PSSEQRPLDRLDRQLAQAAQDLMKDLGASAQDLDEAAQDIDSAHDDQTTEQQKEEMRQALQELRNLLRQEGPGSKGRVVRMQRFERMARGQGTGQRGQPQPGDGTSRGPGSDPSGKRSDQRAGAQGATGAGDPAQDMWVLGDHGQKILMLSKVPDRSEVGEGTRAGSPGRTAPLGDGHDPHLQGRATNPKMGTEDTEVSGADTGQGPSRSQVILGAAQRGFASHGYEKVYTEYHQVAEESFAKDAIPGGYRFYVKRYFQLIRPREAP
ncbi:MAG: hypothetical protein ACREJ3_05940, partial [Polyangiaceae bacterium]